ncbi:MAG: TRAP transporter large permease [Deltaproteobacteria bacterium]|nr:TRAP transporter large permease [Deltaproteobacteria bacterium]MBW2017318.1 TRAP transporter large permease [Deltaproteobacteria bacterium]MBW2128789.1 TRAP transporter large permease [Deltaproteobacteria bacterium]MBW2303786.1 TRAP transporter large permease [Deltaproteobacteria bacterium]
MSPITIGILGILLLFLFLAMRMQIGFAMALVGFLGFIALNSFESAIGVLGIDPIKTTADYTLSVIPLFLLMGQFAHQSGMGTEIYNMLYRWIGFLPGGLAMATVGACACFAAISGSSLATAAMFGAIALPEMKKLNYADTLATGCIAAGGTLGILIPPSSVLILYGILTEQSIARLFIAGMIPGICLALIFMGTIWVATKINPAIGAAGPKFKMKEKVASLRSTWSLLALFVLVIGGLYTGWFTPTEAAGAGAFGAFVVTILKRRLTWRNFLDALKDTAHSTAFIFGILIGAMIFQYFVTLSQIPDQLAGWIVNIGVGRYVVISAIICGFMVLGCFMEGLSIMVLAVPIVYPIVVRLGFDPIWFGVIITLTMEMSLITPPVGVNVFVLSGVAKDIPMYTIFRGIVPFWIAMIICIILLTAFPQIVLFLPNRMM